MTDRIRWINHAGFELSTSGIRIVCDPWLSGFAFNSSWALLAETRFTPRDFVDVDYVWFSHEHPDHFSPADIKSIPPEIRSTISVLFQKTDDHRVVNFLKELGFKSVRELMDWERIELAPGVHFSLCSVGDDSLCMIETPTRTYLNLNDCVSADPAKFHHGIAGAIGKNPDVLLTQFSFANWVGNPGETANMQNEARKKLDQIQIQLDVYKPRVLIPFASYVWFCRPDNFHLNTGSNKIGDVYDRFSQQVDCVVLYPGDEYAVGEVHDSSTAISRYSEDERQHDRPLPSEGRKYSFAELDELSLAHQRKIRERNKLWTLYPLALTGFIKPITIHLTDIGASLRYSMFSGIKWLDLPRDKTDIEFSSAAMALMLQQGFGYDTLYISGRFIERTPGAHLKLSKNFVVLRRNEHGQFFPNVFFDMRRVRARLIR